MRVSTKRGPNEVPWSPSYNYDCSEGHVIQADRPVSQCPAFNCGEPCRGDLTPFGKGSRTTARAAAT